MTTEIPSEVYLGFLDRTIEVHWNYHAWLMFGIWFGFVPFALLITRFFKPRPRPYGLGRNPATGKPFEPFWARVHIWGLYTAIGLSLAGAGLAMLVSGGFSGSLHSFFGLATVTFGCLQIVAAWFRGSHGGKWGKHSDPDDPSTWHGDHYDMTPQRRWFEAYHKTAGYFALFLAVGAITSGLSNFWMPAIALTFSIVLLGGLALVVIFEGQRRRIDTYRSVYGNHPDHPWNRAREGL
ncbi:MAG: cytochrome b561 domain-containing protein [Paracoccaceae bacterium]